jgi:hypothetical protein
MPFNDALTSGELTSLRGDASTPSTYQNRIFLSSNANAVVYSARINQTTFDNQLVALTYDSGAGFLGDVMVDMTVLISRTNDPKTFFFRGRVRLGPTADTLYINETSGADFQDDDYIFILDDFGIHIRLPAPQDTVKIDWDKTFAGLGPIISSLQTAYAGFVDPISGKLTLVLSPTVTPAESGNTHTGSLWDVADGTITVGSTVTKDITVTFPATPSNERWIHYTATDSGGLATTRHIKVWTYSSTVLPTLLDISGVSINCELPVAVNEGASEGWGASITYFDGVENLIDQTFVALWNDERYNGVKTNIVNNIAMVGRFRSEQSATSIDPRNGQIDPSTTFTIEGALAQLGRIDAPSFIARNGSGATTEIIQVNDLTLWRMIWLVLSKFSTFGTVHSLAFDDVTDAFEVDELVTQGGDLLATVGDLAQAITALFQMNQAGECEVVRRAIMLDDAGRLALTTVAAVITNDIILELSNQRDYAGAIGILEANGGGYDSSAGTVSAYIAEAPAGTPKEAPGEGQLPRQILTADQGVVDEQAEMIERAGNAFAAQQSPEILELGLNAGWGFLTPAADQWYTLIIPAVLTARGIAYDGNTRWWLQAISVSPNVQTGNREVLGTFIKETDGADGAIIPIETVNAGPFGLGLGEFDELEEPVPVSDIDQGDDFKIGDGGWSADTGSYTPGSGWDAGCVGGTQEFADITKTFDETKTLTAIIVTYDAVYAGSADGQNKIQIRTSGNAWQTIAVGTTQTGTGKQFVATDFVAPVDQIRVLMYAGGADCGGSLTITSVEWRELTDDTWSHTFDFTISDGGFVVTTAPVSPNGVWVSGSGWEANNILNAGAWRRGIQIIKSHASANLTGISFVYDATCGTPNPDPGTEPGFGINAPLSTNRVNRSYSLCGDGSDLVFEWSGNITVGEFTLRALIDFDATSESGLTGDCVIKSCTVYGKGVNPFV